MNNEVNKEKLKRFLLELLLTGEWSDEFEELEDDGLCYWARVMKLGVIKWTNYSGVSIVEITKAGRAWLDEQRS